MKPQTIWSTLTIAILVGAGCGGSNNASPFNGTTTSSNLPDRSGVSRPSVASGNVPVFLSVKADSLTKDIWVRVTGFEVQTAKGVQKIYDPVMSWLRLSALRDVNGARYLFLGMADRGDPWVRIQLSVGEQYRYTEVGDEKPTDEAFGGQAASTGKGDRVLTLNVDPNAEFKDALVAELALDSVESKFVPKLALGKADEARLPSRQERSLWEGTVSFLKGEPEARYFRLKEHNKFVFATGPETFAGQTTSDLSDKGKVWVWTYFDGEHNQVAVSSVMAASDQTPWIGRVLSYSDEKKTLMLEASQVGANWDGTNAPIVALGNGAWTAAKTAEKTTAPTQNQTVFLIGKLEDKQWTATVARPDVTATVVTYSPEAKKVAEKKSATKPLTPASTKK